MSFVFLGYFIASYVRVYLSIVIVSHDLGGYYTLHEHNT